jgi:hypothetical protein
MPVTRLIHVLFVAACAVLCAVPTARAADRLPTARPAMHFGEVPGKAVGDTIDLMGPGTAFPYRGDFENTAARPAGAGLLPDGWRSDDETASSAHWHVDTYGVVPPLAGNAAWCGDIAFSSCGSGDPAGGYGNDWFDILEFRKTVGAAATVRVQADLVYDCEPAYDYVTLQRRTAANPSFEAIVEGQGLSWTGTGTVAVDYTFTYTEAELYEGTDVAVAFLFDSDSVWSDADCDWPTSGAARLDNITVTMNAIPYFENFEDGVIGPDWTNSMAVGVGDFARVWSRLGDADDCTSNYSNLVAFIDDGLVVPGTGGTIGYPGNDYGPPGGYIVNNTGGLLGPTFHLQNAIHSPVMAWPDPAMGGMSLAFDVYRHELLVADDTPGIFYTWSVRTCDYCDVAIPEHIPWRDRNFVYYGGPNYVRSVNIVDDLVEPGARTCQVALGVYEMGWAFGYGNGTNGTPAPYFDNVRVKIYPTAGARIAATEIRLANDGFPAIGDIDLANLGRNSVRFDMAANVAARSHLRNDPGDSIWIEVTPRPGGTLDLPVMHWTFARRNPLFDPYRSLPASPVSGRVTRTAVGSVVPNRYNFDLPDTGMIFPGDLLHYYFAATDHLAGDSRTAYVPVDRSGFGNPESQVYPGAFSVSGLPSIYNAHGSQPRLLFWNDAGFRGGEDEWYGALRQLCLRSGDDVDVFDTHGPTSGVGNGLGGRASVSQIAGYTDMLYTSGDLGSPTLSNGDFNGDPGNDLGLLNAWFALGGRDLFMTGDDLASSLYGSGSAARTFLESRMGVTFQDTDVRDNIAGQIAPLVVRTAANPVFMTTDNWIAYGGCFGVNDFDTVVPFGGAVRLAQFTAADGVATPYPYAAAILNVNGSGRVVSMNHDLMYVLHPDAKSLSPLGIRTHLLREVFFYFGVQDCLWIGESAAPGVPGALAVSAHPNPFNPSVAVEWTLPRPGLLAVKVYDVRGALVRTLHDGAVATASGRLVWDGADGEGRGVPSGLYFVETRAEGQVDVLKITLLR